MSAKLAADILKRAVMVLDKEGNVEAAKHLLLAAIELDPERVLDALRPSPLREARVVRGYTINPRPAWDVSTGVVVSDKRPAKKNVRAAN